MNMQKTTQRSKIQQTNGTLMGQATYIGIPRMLEFILDIQ